MKLSGAEVLGTLLCLVFALLTGCHGVSGYPREEGHLVIVGGGLKDDNAAVFNRFVELCAPGPIGMIPIASGDGIAAGESTAERWRKYSGTRPVIVIPLTQNDSAKSDDPEIAKLIASCGGLWFTGGDQSRVVKVLRPEGRRSACLAACFGVLGRNGVIGGTSAGAAIMSDPMILGGQSRGRATRDPDETESTVRFGPGLGFLSGPLTDQHFLERGRMGRLVDALNATHIGTGVGIRENSALVVHRADGTCEPIGRRAVCVIQVQPPLQNSNVSTARLSVLSTGDRLTLGTGLATPAVGLAPGKPRVSSGPDMRIGPLLDAKKVADPWEMRTMEASLELFTGGPATVMRENDRIEVTLSADTNSKVFLDPTGARPPCLLNLSLMFRPAVKAMPLPAAK